MKSKNFSKALGEINDKYITEATEYQAKKHHFNWKSLVACAAVIALFFSITPFLNGGKSTTSDGNDQEAPYVPFAFTAYAIDNDHNVSSVVMHEGETVPVSLFNTEDGLKGFVFSYDLTEPGEQTTSVSIITEGVITKNNSIEETTRTESDFDDAKPQAGAGQTESMMKDEPTEDTSFSPYSYVIEEIGGLEMEKDKHYTYYVPEQAETSQYRLMIPRDDLENNTVSEYHLLIEETKNGFVATIEKIVTHERKVIPPKYHN